MVMVLVLVMVLVMLGSRAWAWAEYRARPCQAWLLSTLPFLRHRFGIRRPGRSERSNNSVTVPELPFPIYRFCFLSDDSTGSPCPRLCSSVKKKVHSGGFMDPEVLWAAT